MKKDFNIKSIIIIICCITIIFLATGFAYLSIKLNGYKNKKDYFDISISNVEKGTIVKGGLTGPNCTYDIKNDNKTINLKFKLFQPGDKMTYRIVIKNKGTMKGKIITILNSNDYVSSSYLKNKPQIEIKTTNVNNRRINPGESIEFIINISYLNNMLSNGIIEVPLQFSILAENK